MTRIVAYALACSLLVISSHAAGPGTAVVGGIPNAGFSGRIVETMNSGGYTYLLLESGTNKHWVATFEFEARTGEVAQVESAYEMTGFASPTLNRKFDRIYFASALTMGTNAANVVQGIPQGHHGLGGGAPAGTDEKPVEVVRGTVLETMNAGGYTYVRVKGSNETIWAATTRMEVKAGDRVGVPRGQLMKNFSSPSLNRTFDSIYFVGYIETEGGRKGSDAAANPHGAPAAATQNLAAPVAQPKGGVSIVDLYARRKELAGKTVTTRGQVTKFTQEVMNRNWIHLVDGTGQPGQNEITVTTEARVAVGDIVTVKGRLVLDQDFGYGYSYPVLIEKAGVDR